MRLDRYIIPIYYYYFRQNSKKNAYLVYQLISGQNPRCYVETGKLIAVAQVRAERNDGCRRHMYKRLVSILNGKQSGSFRIKGNTNALAT